MATSNELKSCIYSGYVYHSRRVTHCSKSGNRFKYPVMYMYLDLSELDVVFDKIPFASIDRNNVICWFRNDYIGKEDESLSDSIKDLVYKHCGKRPDKNGNVCVLTLPAQFGYGFNPVSTFYCFNESYDRLQAIVLEVHNTPWLETHCYVLPLFECDKEIKDTDLYTFKWQKRFHVSPFYTMKYDYLWSFNNPNINKDKFKSFGSLICNEKQKEMTPVLQHEWGTSSLAKTIDLNDYQFTAAFNFGFTEMKRWDINIVNMLLFMLYFPVICCMLQLWIHLQAMKVYFKGITIKKHPQNAYVNPITFWIKHSIIFYIGFVGKLCSVFTTFILKIFRLTK